jgi:uncharacterized protein with GYD domain
MATYVILSNISPEAFRDTSEFPKLAADVAAKIKAECPKVKWLSSYALMGAFDVLDIVESPTPEEVEKAAMIIRALGHASTQTMPATPWSAFVNLMKK